MDGYTNMYIIGTRHIGGICVFLFMGIPSVEQEDRQLNLAIGRLRAVLPRDGNQHA